MIAKDFRLIYYISFGVPSIEFSQDMMRFYARCGARFLQLDLPCRNPDPTIEKEYVINRMKQALAACDDFQVYLDAIAQVKSEWPELEIEMTLYEDTVAELGAQALIDFAKKVDMTRMSWIPSREDPDEALLKKLRDAGLQILHPILFHLPQEEIDEAVKAAEPMILMLEGGEGNCEPPRKGYETVPQALKYLRSCGVEGPICVTMGIRTPQRAYELRQQGADGAYVGSCLMKVWDEPAELSRLIGDFEKIAK